MFEDLPRTLTPDPERARIVLKRLLQEVRLVPSADGLVAEVRLPVKSLRRYVRLEVADLMGVMPTSA